MPRLVVLEDISRSRRGGRFERAAADLGRLPLTEVAIRHGYADQSHLTRAVLRHAGETPTERAAPHRGLLSAHCLRLRVVHRRAGRSRPSTQG